MGKAWTKGAADVPGPPARGRSRTGSWRQVDELLINANRNEEAYGSLGFP